ncbi:P-loop containing nucleoside triphosphate hydrolase protein [Apiospora rasikravindrae]|uniref:P-loop containing nucleoside triphosphate hydrolase protein n=1 Tax=Apiospora rasikravindrae TaxID=990691 RepID=A0ABR1TAM7_9PEZI
MGLSLSKLRLGNRHPVNSTDTGAIPARQSNQDVPPARGQRPQPLEMPSQAHDTEPSESHSPGSHLPVDDHDTNTYVETVTSPTASSNQQRFSKKRQISEVSNKPHWSPLPSVIHHPETNVKVFRWEMSGEKRALRIMCSDLCQGLPQLAANSPGVWTEFSGHVVVEPYELIFYNKTRIKQGKTEDLGHGNWQKHLTFLVEQLEAESPKAWTILEAIEARRRKTITFDTVPLLYRPGAVVLRDQHGAWRAYVVERCEHRTSANIESMLIHARFLDFDKTGKYLVPYTRVFELTKFDSELPITSLELLPQEVFDQKPDLIDSIRERGAEYFKYGARAWYRDYHGGKWPRPSRKAPLRVIIDYVTPSKHVRAPGVSNVKEHDAFCSICAGKSLGLDSFPEPEHDAPMCEPEETDREQHQVGFDTDSIERPYLFCPPRLWAFSLQHKTWERVFPHELSEVDTQDKPFDEDLICMEDTKKSHFKSIVREYTNVLDQGKTSDALVQKGPALNVLLCGNTGVGKTFTAECLSEKYGLPLYAMNCGDLGDEPDSFDLRLHETFLRGINWGAIILLDEVDEYVYSRDRHTMKRNYLLPILLRHLETSQSLTIITMTHTEDAEPAFLGHLHWSLHLPGLEFPDQKHLWKKAFKSIPLHLRNERELHNFIDSELVIFEDGDFKHMNARQIANAVRFATVIARGDGFNGTDCVLNAEHIRTTLRLSKKFEEYMQQGPKGAKGRNVDAMRLISAR